MLRKLLIAAATAATLMGGAVATSDTASAAHVTFGFGFGSPYYCDPFSPFCGGYYGPHYGYYGPHYGYYGPHYGYYHPRFYRHGCRTVRMRHRHHWQWVRRCY